ncbi:MAG: 23S rRNA (adenine(2503)-C(2))-methyltransferase RlmN [Myxococcota bacterium]
MNRSEVSPSAAPIQVHGLTRGELRREARRVLGHGAGVYREVYRQVFAEGLFSPERLVVASGQRLGARAIGEWRRAFRADLPEPVTVREEPGALGTTGKAVLRLADGLEIETVSIPMGRERRTLCVSSQVGCKMGCTFCETGRMGLLRRLTADEIIAQLLFTRHRLGWEFRNVVFMGMGEALDNFPALAQALQIMTDPSGMAMAQERITVCTVGDVDGIRRLARLGYKRLNLAVSLNAARDELRRRIMPINQRYPLARLQAALADYRPRRNFWLAINYCLMPGINDQPEDLTAIAEFCRPIPHAMLNVIPYNPTVSPLTRAPEAEEVNQFVRGLRAVGVRVRRRTTKGRTVHAACGQLGNANLRRRRVLPLASRDA